MKHSTMTFEPILGQQLWCYAAGVDASLFRYARRPCPFSIGSEEKIAVLELRCALRLPLFVAGDGKADD